MLNKNISMTLGAALTIFALSATACDSLPTALTQNLPISFAPATSTPAPTDVPTEAPALLPQVATTPVAPLGAAPKRAQAAQALQNLLKGLGLQGGVVTSNSGSTLGLKFGKATAQVQVAPDAIVVVTGETAATLTDVRVGDRVIADVTSSNPNATASFLLDVPANYTADNVMLGAVMPNKNGALNLRTPRGARAVSTSASTLIVNISGSQPALGSISDLNPGSAVVVIGSNSGSTFDAQVIVLLDKDARTLLRKAHPKNAPPSTPTPGA
jgi:hypothetical protein